MQCTFSPLLRAVANVTTRRVDIEPRDMTRVADGALYRTKDARMLASRPYLKQHQSTSRQYVGQGRNWYYCPEPAIFLFRDEQGRYFIQRRYRPTVEKDELVPLTLSQAINVYDRLPEKHVAVEEAFPLEKLDSSELATVKNNQRIREGQAQTYEYDVALTFSGEERELAENLASTLRAMGFSVFYDRWHTPDIWGTELPVTLDEVYRSKSRYCVMFISKSYVERTWTDVERRSAIARAVEERGNTYILPIRVDSTTVPGLPPTLAYVSLQQYSLEEIATFIYEKLSD